MTIKACCEIRCEHRLQFFQAFTRRVVITAGVSKEIPTLPGSPATRVYARNPFAGAPKSNERECYENSYEIRATRHGDEGRRIHRRPQRASPKYKRRAHYIAANPVPTRCPFVVHIHTRTRIRVHACSVARVLYVRESRT